MIRFPIRSSDFISEEICGLLYPDNRNAGYVKIPADKELATYIRQFGKAKVGEELNLDICVALTKKVLEYV